MYTRNASTIEVCLFLSITRFDGVVERCSKSSCTTCTLRFLRSVRLALKSLITIKRGILMYYYCATQLLRCPDKLGRTPVLNFIPTLSGLMTIDGGILKGSGLKAS